MRSFSSSVRSHHAIPSNHPCHAMPCHVFIFLFPISVPFHSNPHFGFRSPITNTPNSVSHAPSPPFFGWKTALIDLIPSLARSALNQRTVRPGPLCSTAADDIHTYVHTWKNASRLQSHPIPSNVCERWFMVVRTRNPYQQPPQRRVLQAHRVGGREGR